MASPVRAAGFVIYRRILNKIEYLLMQASYGDHHWTPPKGHVDPGESDMQTAIRETEEEAGIKKSDLRLIEDYKKEIRYDVGGRPKVVVYWIAELINNVPIVLSNEHQSFEWVSLDRAYVLTKYHEMQEVMQDVNAFLTSKYSTK